MSVRSGGNISIIGDYMGLVNEVPMGSLMNRGITLRTGQSHPQRYFPKLLELIQTGKLDPSFIITHRPRLDEAPEMYKIFNDKEDGCLKVVMKTGRDEHEAARLCHLKIRRGTQAPR